MFRDKFDNLKQDIIIKDIIAADIKTAHVFEKYGIDFCCKGNRPLIMACEEKNLSMDVVLSELEKLNGNEIESGNRYMDWQLKFLIDYIINNHHSFVRKTIPIIKPHLEKVNSKHGGKHPFLKEVKKSFEAFAEEMYSHMQKEETILFKIIKYLVDCEHFNEKPKMKGFTSVNGPITALEHEHSNAGNAMETIRKLTNNFKAPTDACNTFKLLYSELEEFEKDLHIHVHLENNILFPKAIKLEEDLLKK